MIKIKIFGIGGAGNNTVNRIKKADIKGVECVAINTDYQDLKKVKADIKLRIGKKTTLGLGAGMRPEIGEAAALESREEIKNVLKETDLLFLTYGAGGGTGTGAAPVIAELAQKLQILTVALVTLPFSFEGQTRRKIALEGIEKIRTKVDSLLIIKNDRLLEILEPNVSVNEAFDFCDHILKEAILSILHLTQNQGILKINFADLKSILKNSGTALFATARASGENRIQKVVNSVLTSPLLNLNPKGAKGILFNVAGENVSLKELKEIGKTLLLQINPQAKIIFGTVKDDTLKPDEIKLTLIATGFPNYDLQNY
jgi:cell division protein FtsZ